MRQSIELSDEELAILDGKVTSEDTQKKIEEAKQRLEELKRVDAVGIPDDLKEFVSKVLMETKTNGKLICNYSDVSTCPICKRNAGYAKYPRSGKYHRKGDLNWSKPLSFRGVELASRFVRMQGHPTLGCCNECFEKALPYLKEALKDVRAEISEDILGHPSRFKKTDKMKCKECGWEGLEIQMGKLPALFVGNYHGKCPKCGAENRPLGTTKIENSGGFEIVEIQTAKEKQ